MTRFLHAAWLLWSPPSWRLAAATLPLGFALLIRLLPTNPLLGAVEDLVLSTRSMLPLLMLALLVIVPSLEPWARRSGTRSRTEARLILWGVRSLSVILLELAALVALLLPVPEQAQLPLSLLMPLWSRVALLSACLLGLLQLFEATVGPRPARLALLISWVLPQAWHFSAGDQTPILSKLVPSWSRLDAPLGQGPLWESPLLYAMTWLVLALALDVAWVSRKD